MQVCFDLYKQKMESNFANLLTSSCTYKLQIFESNFPKLNFLGEWGVICATTVFHPRSF